MKKMTEDFLKNALAGESQAHVKYAAFAEKADQENLPNVARLFRANSFAEQVHASNHLRALGGIGKTLENLEGAIGGETFEVAEMYDVYKVAAEHQGENTAVMMFFRAMEAEKVHAVLYKNAKDAVSKGKDMDGVAIHVCPVCGFTMDGHAPDQCPLCGVSKEKFVTF
jgi:rubrerythrin